MIMLNDEMVRTIIRPMHNAATTVTTPTAAGAGRPFVCSQRVAG